MSKFEKKKVMPRYVGIAVFLTAIGLAVVAKAGYIMTVKKDYWATVAASQKLHNDTVKPTRGNILSCDGQLMASSIPEYKIYMDFQPGKKKLFEPVDSVTKVFVDSIWDTYIDTLCLELNRTFPQWSAQEFKANLLKGRHKQNMRDGKLESVGARHWPIWPGRMDYNTFTELRKLPIFNLPPGKGGFHWETYNTRSRPFGSLASRTLGGIKVASDSAYYGLELSYDSLLRGNKGIVRYQKVRNKTVTFTEVAPEDGADIVTTIDVGMQDLVERSLIEEMKKPLTNGEMGVAILMEVKTGDIKAIASLTKGKDGEYHESQNHAIQHRCEPGSVFKVASILVALDDGVVDTSYVIHTGHGVVNMHGRDMKDHNWRNGHGYGDINVARSLEVSSNVGVSHVIDHFYNQHPEKYVEGLYRIGIHDSLPLPLQGYAPPVIRMPRKNKRGQYENWSKTALPWMSIGYETQIPPINTVTLYNAIANDGCMMRPRFVKKVIKDGKVLYETKPEVQRKLIAKPQTIKTMQTILRHVVSQGLGKKAGSPSFQVSGKTGTAQVADQYGGYHSGIPRYWLSFCGYFPSDNPLYTCIVCIKKSGTPASGGGMSGVAFHHIAEGVMAQRLKLRVEDARDTSSVLIPDVKNGNIEAADYVLSQLGVKTDADWQGTHANGAPIWGKARREENDVILSQQKIGYNNVPDVLGMGASDAIFLLEDLGLKVHLNGTGRVRRQSIPSGQAVRKGMVCELYLE